MYSNELKHIKCVISDLDGTLLNDEKQLDSEIIPVIQQLKEKGILFTIASGRNMHIVKDLIEKMNIQIPYICNNGAEIYNKYSCIYQQYINNDDHNNVIAMLIQEKISFLAYTQEALYCFRETVELINFAKRLNGCCKILYINSKEEVKGIISKIVCIPNSDKEGEALISRINTMSKTLFCTQSENEVYTITSNKATKGEALKVLLSTLNISEKNIVVFGDNYNDLSMFEVAHYSVAMENASIDVKNKANFITISNEENGVSYFLKKHLL